MKSAIALDVETTAIPSTGISGIKAIHCIAATNVGTGEKYFADSTTGYATILNILKNANILIAHNAISFDIPVLIKFFI